MRTGFAGLAVISAAALVLTACSTSENPASPTNTGGTVPTGTSTSTSIGEPTSTPPRAGTRVEVSENEFTITLSRKDFTPGTYTFAVDNKGKASHDLSIKGPGVDTTKTKTLSGGSK